MMLYYLCKGKTANMMPYLLVLSSCIFRLLLPLEVVTTLTSSLDRLVYIIYPLALWVYLQKIYTFFSSFYIRVRYSKSKYFLMKQYFCELILVIAFSTVIAIVNLILYWQKALGMEILFFFINTCCIYVLLISIIHLVFILKKDYKIAFVTGYICLLTLYLSDFIMLLGIPELAPQWNTIIFIVSLSLAIIALILTYLHGRKECDFYEII